MLKIKKLLPKRSKNSSKIDGGKVCIIGGGKGLFGAGILSALAATRCGAGYTHLMSELSTFPWMTYPDFIVHPLKLSELKDSDDFTIGIGPGLGRGDLTKKFLRALIKKNFQKVVVDADALSVLAETKLKIPDSWILTPHEGELARLIKRSSAEVKANRIDSLEAAYKKYQCTIILKGAETLIISPETSVVKKIKSGTPALAKAGTGDVLLGMVSAFRAQGLSSLDAAVLGTTLHGLAAREWLKKKNDHLSLRPVDLIELLPKILYKIRGTR